MNVIQIFSINFYFAAKLLSIIYMFKFSCPFFNHRECESLIYRSR